MIDPYLIEDKEESGKWWCFYKQNGASMSWSIDLETCTYCGHVDAGENVCLLIEEEDYVLFHSPKNGLSVPKTIFSTPAKPAPKARISGSYAIVSR